MKMAKFIISVDEAIAAVRKQFGLPESVEVQIEFEETSSVKSDNEWQDVPEDWTLGSPPGELDYNDQVEIVFRDATISSGLAGDFGTCWSQDGNRLDIVKYRRV